MEPTSSAESLLQKACKDYFMVDAQVAQIIAHGLPTSATSQASLFVTKSGNVLLFISSQGGQVLDDVVKIAHRMGLEADTFYPPHGDSNYFLRVAQAKFKGMFPGKHLTSDEDLRYYKSIAPYNPALVRISRIDGEVRAYDARGKAWHKALAYSYTPGKVKA